MAFGLKAAFTLTRVPVGVTGTSESDTRTSEAFTVVQVQTPVIQSPSKT